MKYLSLFLIVILCSCITPTFTVKEADSRFNENKDRFFTSDGNRISTKSIVGGTHLLDEGVYINPFVSKDNTGRISLLGLHINNRTDYDTRTGKVNHLGYIKAVIFRLSDGRLIDLKVTKQVNRNNGAIYYNSVTGIASITVLESGTTYITKEQFKQIATAKQISCKIYGTYQSVTYEVKDISPAFLVNLNRFFQAYVK